MAFSAGKYLGYKCKRARGGYRQDDGRTDVRREESETAEVLETSPSLFTDNWCVIGSFGRCGYAAHVDVQRASGFQTEWSRAPTSSLEVDAFLSRIKLFLIDQKLRSRNIRLTSGELSRMHL